MASWKARRRWSAGTEQQKGKSVKKKESVKQRESSERENAQQEECAGETIGGDGNAPRRRAQRRGIREERVCVALQRGISPQPIDSKEAILKELKFVNGDDDGRKSAAGDAMLIRPSADERLLPGTGSRQQHAAPANRQVVSSASWRCCALFLFLVRAVLLEMKNSCRFTARFSSNRPVRSGVKSEAITTL